MVGIAEGSGDANAKKRGTPRNTLNAGVVIALPPFPSNPEINPTTAPMAVAPM